jgi:hypothetical protein
MAGWKFPAERLKALERKRQAEEIAGGGYARQLHPQGRRSKKW